jgi:hypothetical protein
MKRLFNLTFLAAMLSLVAITSCDTPTEEPQQPIPTLDTIECEAGDKPTFEFSASHDWQLSSDAMWCKFISSNGEVQDISGKAGNHTITLKITDQGIKDEPTTAKITIKMGGISQTLVTVERSAKRLNMRIYDANDRATQSIELGYNTWIKFSIEANFRFAATDFPEWMELGTMQGSNIVSGAVTGAPNERVEAYARIINNNERECQPITAEDNHMVTFSNEERSATFNFSIIFNGMSENDLSIVSPTSNTFGLEVSLDGKEFRQEDAESGEMISYGSSLQYKIAARNHEYSVLLIEKVIERGIPTHHFNASWMAFDYATMTLTVSASDTTRYGIVMALPNGIYNDICNDLSANIFELDDSAGIDIETIKYDFLKYILAEFTQCDFTERGEYEGFYVYHSLTALEIPATPYTDSAVIEQYGASEAYTCPFVNSVEGKRPGVIIDPRIEEWTTATFEEGRATAEVIYKGEKLKISENEYYMGENKDERMAIHLWGPKSDYTEDVYVIFKVDGVAKKMLVVTPPTK